LGKGPLPHTVGKNILWGKKREDVIPEKGTCVVTGRLGLVREESHLLQWEGKMLPQEGEGITITLVQEGFCGVSKDMHQGPVF